MTNPNYGLSISEIPYRGDLEPTTYYGGAALNSVLPEFSGTVQAHFISDGMVGAPKGTPFRSLGETATYSNLFDLSMTPVAPTIAQGSTNVASQHPTRSEPATKVTGNAYKA